ncbi:MAG: acyl carrier protein [Bacillota bacterium]
MTTGAQLLNRVERLFEHKLGLPVPSPDVDLLKSGVMDSLTFVNMLLHIEKEFGVKFTLEDIDLEKFRTTASIAEHLAKLAVGGGARERVQRPVGGIGGRRAGR